MNDNTNYIPFEDIEWMITNEWFGSWGDQNLEVVIRIADTEEIIGTLNLWNQDYDPDDRFCDEQIEEFVDNEVTKFWVKYNKKRCSE